MKKLVPTSIILAALTACAAIPADPNTNNIIISPNPVPAGCKYLGQVVGNQGNFLTGGFTSNRNLEEGAMNDLKNKASKLGANYIQLITNRAGVTGSMGGGFAREGGYMSGGSQQTNITNVGNAYRCPPKVIGLS